MHEKEEYISLFARLGDLLDGFGADDASADAVRRAAEANRWFSAGNIAYAVAAIRENMLRADILRQWLEPYAIDYSRRRRIAVIMAGNIPLVGFSDLLCVLAAGCSCHVKMSSKDTALMEYVIGLLRQVWPEAPVYAYDDAESYDAVIATGSDNTNRYFRARFADTPALLRGSRYSAAVLTGDESDAELRGLSDDVFLYNGMGCRNVSLIFVPEGADVERLCRAILPQDDRVGYGYKNNYRQTKALLSLQGRSFVDGGCFVMTPGTDFPAELSRINYCYYNDGAEVVRHLNSIEEKLQVVVSSSELFPRTACFGQAQRPYPWDYADGHDVMEFITHGSL